MQTNPLITALLQEREGYVRRKLAPRVAQVDAVLKTLGYHISETEVAAVKADTEHASAPKRTKRTIG